jgi:hypothetical protein
MQWLAFIAGLVLSPISITLATWVVSVARKEVSLVWNTSLTWEDALPQMDVDRRMEGATPPMLRLQ